MDCERIMIGAEGRIVMTREASDTIRRETVSTLNDHRHAGAVLKMAKASAIYAAMDQKREITEEHVASCTESA